MLGEAQRGSQPFLRWAGSKRQLVPFLREYWTDKYETYIEPFCGSACLFFCLSPNTAVLGDINEELISAYRQIKTDPERVIEAIRRLPPANSAYYSVRQQDPKLLSDVEAAARFIYLNHHCFNGLYRTNLIGQFNVPLGRPKLPRKIDEAAIRQAAQKLRSAYLIGGDFLQTLDYAGKGDFVYLDPPYVTSKDSTFREYGPKPFGTSDLEQLGSELNRLHNRKTKFIVSYLDTALARRVLSRWTIRTLYARRNIAGFTGSRRKVREILATNISL